MQNAHLPICQSKIYLRHISLVDMQEENKYPKGVVHSKVVKAGKRTYFIDVRQTQAEDYYITLTESAKKQNGDKSFYVRNKIIIYKEDFNKVFEGLAEMINLVKTDLMPDFDYTNQDKLENQENSDDILDDIV